MKYKILKVFHNPDYDVLEIIDKKTGRKENYAFPMQSNDVKIKLRVK